MKLIMTLLMLGIFLGLARAEAVYTDEQIANAIYWAEGGYKAKYLYGIVSVKYTDITEARQICLNTIRNQRKRHIQHNCGLAYLECLANRYAPIGAGNDPKGLNKNWLKNVRYFLSINKETPK